MSNKTVEFRKPAKVEQATDAFVTSGKATAIDVPVAPESGAIAINN
jgi:hypothetical protein